MLTIEILESDDNEVVLNITTSSGDVFDLDFIEKGGAVVITLQNSGSFSQNTLNSVILSKD